MAGVYFLLLNAAGSELGVMMKGLIDRGGNRKIRIHADQVHQLERSHPKTCSAHKLIYRSDVGNTVLHQDDPNYASRAYACKTSKCMA